MLACLSEQSAVVEAHSADPVHRFFIVLIHSEASLRKGELSGYFDEVLNQSKEGKSPLNVKMKSPPSREHHRLHFMISEYENTLH